MRRSRSRTGLSRPSAANDPPLPDVCQAFAHGSSPGDHQNAIRQRITLFDRNKGNVDTAWLMGLALDVTFTCLFPSGGSVAGVIAWISNVGDFRLAGEDRALSKAQYIEAQAHRRVAVQACKELADHVAAHPDHQQAADLLRAMTEIVKLLDGVLNSYENFYKPPTEAALRQERRLRQQQHLQKCIDGILKGQQQDPDHVLELNLLQARVDALPLGRKERRVSLAQLRAQQAAVVKRLVAEDLSDDLCTALTQELATLDKDIKSLEDHQKAVARPLVLRKPKHFGQKQAKVHYTVDIARARIPLDVANAGLSVASVVPQIAAASVDAALGLPIAAAIAAGVGAILGHRSSDLEGQEAKKEKELHRRNIAASYQRIENAQRLLKQLENCADSPQVRVQRRALRNQISAQLKFITQSKASLRLGQVRNLKRKLTKRLFKMQMLAAVVTAVLAALAVPAAGAALMATGLLSTAALAAFLAYVVYGAKWRERTITQKLLYQQLAFEHVREVLGEHGAMNLSTLPLERLEMVATALRRGAPPKLQPYLTAEKLQGGNPFFAIEWMAQGFHAASLDRQAGKDVQLKDYPGAAMAIAMGLPTGTAEYLSRGGKMFDSQHPERHLGECRRVIAGNLFQLPVADKQQLAAFAEPSEVLALTNKGSLAQASDALTQAGGAEALPASGAFTLSSPPVAVPRELSPEQVAMAIRDAGKKEWSDKTLRIVTRPRDSAKQLMKRQNGDGVHPEHWGRIVTQLKAKLPRDPVSKEILIPAPYASVDEWLVQELPMTAARAIETGDTFKSMEGTGQDKQRKSAEQRYHDIAAVTTHCTQWLTQSAAAAAA